LVPILLSDPQAAGTGDDNARLVLAVVLLLLGMLRAVVGRCLAGRLVVAGPGAAGRFVVGPGVFGLRRTHDPIMPTPSDPCASDRCPRTDVGGPHYGTTAGRSQRFRQSRQAPTVSVMTWLRSPAHARWLERESDELLTFGAGSMVTGGFGYLDRTGEVIEEQGLPLW